MNDFTNRVCAALGAGGGGAWAPRRGKPYNIYRNSSVLFPSVSPGVRSPDSDGAGTGIAVPVGLVGAGVSAARPGAVAHHPGTARLRAGDSGHDEPCSTDHLSRSTGHASELRPRKQPVTQRLLSRLSLRPISCEPWAARPSRAAAIAAAPLLAAAPRPSPACCCSLARLRLRCRSCRAS
jgi:hypothetical protein